MGILVLLSASEKERYLHVVHARQHRRGLKWIVQPSKQIPVHE